jgi:tripartite-type tricarboxylate transporter receptor subunit TctC
MKIPRRKFLGLALSAGALPTLPRIARAQAYPSRPVRILVGFAPAGGVDIAARLMAQWLSERLGQQFIVENRPGGSTNIATEAALRARPDGYTLVMLSVPAAINATFYEKLNFNVIRDIAPIAAVLRAPYVLAVNPSIPVKTVPELISYAKANPGKLAIASSGPGSGLHLAGELFKMMSAIDMVHVPYRGEAPAVTDLIGGQVQVMFSTTTASIEHIRAGTVRALAVTTAMRAEVLPDIPGLSEFLPGYEASFWVGFGASRNTPVQIIQRLNKEINAALAEPKIKARIAELGSDPLPGSSADFGRLLAEETEKWGKVIRAANVRPE